jgi:hypothetical protein
LNRRSYVRQDFVIWTGVYYVVQECVSLYRTVLSWTGVCYVEWECVKLDWRVLN